MNNPESKRQEMERPNIRCTLCSNTILDTSFTRLERDIIEVAGIVHLNLNSREKNCSDMCSECYVKLVAAFNFKAKCMDTEDLLFPYVNSEKDSFIDLKEIHIKQNSLKYSSEICDEKICRLCMEVTGHDAMSVVNVDHEIISNYIPEVNFNSTKDPVLCKPCYDSLSKHGNFLKSCQHVKEEIETVCDDGVTELSYSAKTEELDIKSENIDIEQNEELDNMETNEYEKEYGKEYCDETVQKNYSSEMKGYKPDLSNFHEGGFTAKKVMHKKSQKVQMFRCNDCPFATIYRHSFENHQLRHKDPSDIPKFQCHDCNYKTIYTNYLKLHQLRHKDPSDIHKFQCHECDYKTIYKNHLKTHQLRHMDASQGQMFKCDTCDYKTPRKDCLKVHQLKHKDPSDVHKFQCHECDYKTTAKSSLKTHQLRHMDASQVQMFKCDTCDFETKYKNSLKGHLLVHSDPSEVNMYKCDTCDYETLHKNCLKVHQLKHKDPSNKLKFQCHQCDYKTIYKNCLKTHQLRHMDASQVQMFKCDTCDYKTLRKDSLKLQSAQIQRLFGRTQVPMP